MKIDTDDWPQTMQVGYCGDCPFLDHEVSPIGTLCCNSAGREFSRSHLQEKTRPSWCPLDHAPVLVLLRQPKEASP